MTPSTDRLVPYKPDFHYDNASATKLDFWQTIGGQITAQRELYEDMCFLLPPGHEML